MALLDDVKTALRISHNALDTDIAQTIIIAQQELLRSGVVNIDTTEPLIAEAIKTYCLEKYSDDNNTADRYDKSFKYQLDNLRKSEGFGYITD